MFFEKLPKGVLEKICRKSSKKVLILNKLFWETKMSQIVQSEKLVFMGNALDFQKIFHFSTNIRYIEYKNVPKGFLILVPNAREYIFSSCEDRVDLGDLNRNAKIQIHNTQIHGIHPSIPSNGIPQK